MNFSLHITASGGKSFEAYPNDSQKDRLRSLSAGNEDSKLAIWIEEGVIYYYSVFKLPGRYRFGILLGFKDLVISSPLMLMKLMSDIVSDVMPREGSILRYSTDGDIVLANKKLAEDTQAVDTLRDVIDKRLISNSNRLKCLSEKIPSIIAPTETVYMEPSAFFVDIRQKLLSRHTVVLSAGSAFNSDKTYAIISGLRSDLQKKDEELAANAERIRRLERSRKQYRFVVGLFGCLALAGVGLYRLNNSLHLTEKSLGMANDSISAYSDRLEHAYNTILENNRHIARLDTLTHLLEEKNRQQALDKTTDSLRLVREIDSKVRDISQLEYDRRQLDSKLSNTQTEVRSLNTKVNRLRSLMAPYPFIGTGFSRAGKTLYISYNAPASKSVKIQVRCYSASSYIAHSDHNVSVSEGSGKLSISDVNGLDKAKYVVIYYDGNIIAGQWF